MLSENEKVTFNILNLDYKISMYRSTHPIGEFLLGNLPNIKGGFAGVYNSLGNQVSVNHSQNNEYPQTSAVTNVYYAKY